ncbi:5'-deoxyadenosine deaminase [Paenibacillus sp. IB182496]|uniref:5-methylthioadenosine/S-adenosylhomocysteine deaminase n=1 Tax=Paenibacillus sabuli TaxID=2772509 RepID=A0A927BP35_9BACL|nr:5'-deoxyadenosine deaminase [Paenibacillus sabuli]MBD2844123.1 5'-deoxyadenosine deaminase [Paenibacillus sabuli]
MTGKLIRNAQIVTMNADNEVLLGNVRIAQGRIAAIGPEVAAEAGDQVVEAGGKLLLPGFVQTHIHLCQTLFRGRADDMALIDWLRKRIWPMEAAHDADSIYYSAMLGLGELIRSGTTTILDMETVRHTDAAFEAIKTSGMRAISGKVMMDHGTEVPPELQEETADSLQQSVELLEKWHGAADGRIQYAFSPRFVVSCSESLLLGVRDLATQYGVLIHTHASENETEIAIVEAERGMRNVVYLDRLGLARPNLILAHCVWLDDEEREIIRRRGVKMTHCPGSNMKLASGIAEVAALHDAGIAIGLGADGASCNNNLDMFQEMRLAALLQKVRRGPEVMPAPQVLRMATMGGAEVLGMEGEIGSIEVGKRADLQLLDLEDYHTYPSYDADPFARVVYAATRGDVDSVWIGGETVMRGRRLLTIDRSDTLHGADRALARLLRRLPGA